MLTRSAKSDTIGPVLFLDSGQSATNDRECIRNRKKLVPMTYPRNEDSPNGKTISN
jgi:hypothetical protein